MLILGLETSCDETSCAIVENGKKILSCITWSQIKAHEKFYGIVPEIASRLHVEKILYVIEETIKKANVDIKDIDIVAVTSGPGLIGSLLVGLTAAKTLSLFLRKPLICVDHIAAHMYAAHLEYDDIKYPAIGGVISGGHTHFYYMSSPTEYSLISKTIDDAAGEAFDKVAAILRLGYPGGPSIEKISKEGKPIINFPISIIKRDKHLFLSFSGIKTAVLYYCKGKNKKKYSPNLDSLNIPDIASSFQEKVVSIIVELLERLTTQYNIRSIILGGGVCSNTTLKEKIYSTLNKYKIFIPSSYLCIDNAAMVAGFAYIFATKGKYSSFQEEAYSTLKEKIL